MHRQQMEILMNWLLNSDSLSPLTGGYSAATPFKLPGIILINTRSRHKIQSVKCEIKKHDKNLDSLGQEQVTAEGCIQSDSSNYKIN